MFTKPLAAVLVLVLLAVACSSDDSVTDDAGPVETTSPTPTTAAPESDPTSSPTSIPERPPAIDALGVWQAMWDGAELLVTDPTTAEAQLAVVATPGVREQLTTIFAPIIDGQPATTVRTFESFASVSESGDGTITVDDCIQVSPPDTAPFVWFSGTALAVEGEWVIDSVEPKALGGCVPGEIASAAIDGYEAYWDARLEFWDPAEPDHPLMAATLTGPQLDVIRNLLVDHEAQGLVLRGRPDTNPEVVQITSPTELTLLDCMVQDPERGLFVAETGERSDDIAPVVEGQRDLRSTVMVLEKGVWKVSDLQGQANVRCDIAPTVQGLPSA